MKRIVYLMLFLIATAGIGARGCWDGYGSSSTGPTMMETGFTCPGAQDWYYCNFRCADVPGCVPAGLDPTQCGTLMCAADPTTAVQSASQKLGYKDPAPGMVCQYAAHSLLTLGTLSLYPDCVPRASEPPCAELHQPCLSPDTPEGTPVPCCPGLVCDQAGIMPPGQSSQCCIGERSHENGRTCKDSSECCQVTDGLGCVDGVCACRDTGDACTAPFDIGNTPCCAGPCEGGRCCAWEGAKCNSNLDCCSEFPYCHADGCGKSP